MKPSIDTSFFGHPGGLRTLFFTEMWERMSYYGMRALLVLFMTASLQTQGLGLTVATAGAIYGLYTGAVYFLGLPGGWLADRLIGGKQAVWYGGLIIFAGHVVLAIDLQNLFFVGLILVASGTGLLKPNISAMVGQQYGEDDGRRDSGYALYYMGINIGSLIAYLVTGYLQENWGWHYAFGAAAVGMAIGLIQYYLSSRTLSAESVAPANAYQGVARKRAWTGVLVVVAAAIAVIIMAHMGSIVIEPIALAQKVAIFFTAIFFLYFGFIYFKGDLSENEKRRMWALFLVCVASACFWSGFEQAGSSLNLFAQNYTDRVLSDGSFLTSWFGMSAIPTVWFQLSNSLFIIILSPFFAALWINLAKRMIDPSYTIKCAVGIIIMASGFLVMFMASQYAAQGLKVAPMWLVTTYFLHTVGELCLSPVALSAVSKLSPKRFAGQMMGVFVLTYSIGNIIAGLLSGNFDPENVKEMPNLYLQIALFSIAVGIVIALLSVKSRFWEKAGIQEKT
ncbi:peptide MFS transporter [Alteromonas sp.]|jgi:POT family proton-dependent oligopeptide transporter|uniref:peptide MFS transporter n=1 Tax=Alteromonas sp. TaxID=232 RepID=UPI000B6DC08D|nr:peptide MFS transporter [Alteromonas sp.]MAI39516.1 MFS transporter [Alteromonas sp.]OUX83638.1 MAG: MFS transporter [Alteromonas sp. TMED35]|tara:strand:- start:29252 stop:30772 length:1521 start_codon:yes stop_codon:yes gene_type:complete